MSRHPVEQCVEEWQFRRLVASQSEAVELRAEAERLKAERDDWKGRAEKLANKFFRNGILKEDSLREELVRSEADAERARIELSEKDRVIAEVAEQRDRVARSLGEIERLKAERDRYAEMHNQLAKDNTDIFQRLNDATIGRTLAEAERDRLRAALEEALAELVEFHVNVARAIMEAALKETP